MPKPLGPDEPQTVSELSVEFLNSCDQDRPRFFENSGQETNPRWLWRQSSAKAMAHEKWEWSSQSRRGGPVKRRGQAGGSWDALAILLAECLHETSAYYEKVSRRVTIQLLRRASPGSCSAVTLLLLILIEQGPRSRSLDGKSLGIRQSWFGSV